MGTRHTLSRQLRRRWTPTTPALCSAFWNQGRSPRFAMWTCSQNDAWGRGLKLVEKRFADLLNSSSYTSAGNRTVVAGGASPRRTQCVGACKALMVLTSWGRGTRTLRAPVLGSPAPALRLTACVKSWSGHCIDGVEMEQCRLAGEQPRTEFLPTPADPVNSGRGDRQQVC